MSKRLLQNAQIHGAVYSHSSSLTSMSSSVTVRAAVTRFLSTRARISLNSLSSSPSSASSSLSFPSSSALTLPTNTSNVVSSSIRHAHAPHYEAALKKYPDRTAFSYRLGRGAIGIRLNRPKQLNAVNLEMVRELEALLHAIGKNKDLTLCVMSGIGRAFCAGGDIVSLYHAGLERKRLQNVTGDHDLTKVFFREEYALNFHLSHSPIPIMPVMNGITMGGGVGLSCHCRQRAATPKTVFAFPEVAIGFFPDVGASFMLPRLMGQIGRSKLGIFLGMTGYRLTGYDLLHADIATHWSFADEFDEHVAFNYTANALDYHQANNTMEAVFWKIPHEDLAEIPPFSLASHLDWIDRTFAHDTVERIMEELSLVDNPVAQQALQAMRSASPTSLKVTLRLLREGATKTLQECLQMEYRVAQRMMLGHDFYEGVKNMLITKERNPKWQPARLEEVSRRDVDAYFAPLVDQDELILDYPQWKEPQWYV